MDLGAALDHRCGRARPRRRRMYSKLQRGYSQPFETVIERAVRRGETAGGHGSRHADRGPHGPAFLSPLVFPRAAERRLCQSDRPCTCCVSLAGRARGSPACADVRLHWRGFGDMVTARVRRNRFRGHGDDWSAGGLWHVRYRGPGRRRTPSLSAGADERPGVASAASARRSLLRLLARDFRLEGGGSAGRARRGRRRDLDQSRSSAGRRVAASGSARSQRSQSVSSAGPSCRGSTWRDARFVPSSTCAPDS